jgi:outer membrane assembly lipoprotein YfiO
MPSGCITATLCLLTTISALCADDQPTYRERLEYDPATGQWIEKPPPIAGTEAGDLAIGRARLARGEFRKARKTFQEWFKAYPDSSLRAEALFYAAETEVAAEDDRRKSGHLIRAYEHLEEIIQGWPGTELADRALRKELIIAEMILFKNRRQRVWGGTLWLDASEEALQMLDRIIDDHARDTPVAEQALRLKADYHYQSGEFEEAEMAYSRLGKDFPRGRYQKIALLRSGESALARFPGVDFDDADLLEAEVYFQDFEKRFPPEAEPNRIPQRLLRIRESRAEKEFSVGRYYERTRKIDAAAFYYRLVVQHYPGTTSAVEAHQRLIAIGAVEPGPAPPDPVEPQP